LKKFLKAYCLRISLLLFLIQSVAYISTRLLSFVRRLDLLDSNHSFNSFDRSDESD
jgi:hypothetical protein